MFGFIRLKQFELRQSATPLSQEGAILVSKEDIYREVFGMEPVLLLRKGYEVTQEELPRFLRNGARPSQFMFKGGAPCHGASIPVEQAVESAFSPLKPPVQSFNRRAQARSVQNALILEPDAHSNKRLIDCLFNCGLSLDRIRPVRAAAQFEWSFTKYQPDLVIVDYHIGSQQNGLSLLLALRSRLPNVRLVLTLGTSGFLSSADRQRIQSVCREKRIAILPKPVSRFMLKRILLEDF